MPSKSNQSFCDTTISALFKILLRVYKSMGNNNNKIKANTEDVINDPEFIMLKQRQRTTKTKMIYSIGSVLTLKTALLPF